MRIVKWSTEAKADFNSILGFILQNWSAKEAENYMDEIYKLVHIIEKDNVDFKKTRFKNIRVAVLSKQISIYYRIQSKSKVEIIRIWDNRQNPKRFVK
jgi:plasmid stabilization system protein ParE